MTSRNDILISACDAQAIGLMLGDWPRRHRLEQETAAELATTIASARIVASDELAHDVVAMDSTVTYVEIPDGGAETVRIVYPVQANAGAGRVSVLSPIGRALLGRFVGSVIDVLLPTGRQFAIRIVEVSRGRVSNDEALALA
ncbi:MAG: GreA/GreB family elongation factor [Burkholderiales bacterium]